ncbi:hypothetical protein K505DRAFT_317271 [Melanomma pulvis-pyrius CBS 109.77]|uniref:Uncharacterized protein n=1 Tax=Melanomma pulvis-pyrius CBS 109.77 TaxID=1314802 RepID=A0A6A6WSI3_9PLEO|nr:hypothetical protein K505DRAFT_317271 [Melanomma pulvis-pyrius CBS 109.77]
MRIYAPLAPVGLFFSALCIANPEADPQQYTNNAPFSGAIYIVSPNGQQVTTTGTNMCPNYASISCSNINQPSWCCPNSFTCAAPPNSGGLIGCCPAGSSCGGSVNVASVTTITVQAAQQTNVVYVQPQPTTVAVYNVQQGVYCSTLTMDGPGLPTTRQGDCGTILIVNEGIPNMRTIGCGLGIVVVLLHLALGRMFQWI